MRTSTDMSSGKRFATIAIAAVIAASFAVPASAAHKKRNELMPVRPTAAAAFGSTVDPGRYPTYRAEGGCIEDQGNGRIVPCTSN